MQGLDPLEILVLASWAEEEIQRLRAGLNASPPPPPFGAGSAGRLARLKYLRTAHDSGKVEPLAPGEASSLLKKCPRLIESVRVRRLLHDSARLADVCGFEERKLGRAVKQLSKVLVDPKAAEEIEALMARGLSEEEATEFIAEKYGFSDGGLRMRRSRVRKASGKGKAYKRRGPRRAGRRTSAS